MPSRIMLYMLLVYALGCGQSNQVPSTTNSQRAPEPAGEMITRPEYANWSQFPVGTEVTRLRTTTNDKGQVLVTTRIKLVSKDEHKIVLETQIDVQRPKAKLERNDPMTNEYTSKFALPAGMQAEQFMLPSLKAVKVGNETTTLLEREYDTEVYQWDDSSESGPISCKLWASNDMPGRVLRQEQVNAGAKFNSQETVTELIVPELAPQQAVK